MSVPTVRSMMERLHNHKEQLWTIFEQHGVERVWIFGSVARGEETEVAQDRVELIN